MLLISGMTSSYPVHNQYILSAYAPRDIQVIRKRRCRQLYLI